MSAIVDEPQTHLQVFIAMLKSIGVIAELTQVLTKNGETIVFLYSDDENVSSDWWFNPDGTLNEVVFPDCCRCGKRLPKKRITEADINEL